MLEADLVKIEMDKCYLRVRCKTQLISDGTLIYGKNKHTDEKHTEVEVHTQKHWIPIEGSAWTDG